MWNIYIRRWSECKESLPLYGSVYSKMASVGFSKMTSEGFSKMTSEGFSKMWKYPFHISFTSLLKMLITTQFLRADHQIDHSETEYQLKHTDDCKVSTRYFCSMCIATSVLPNEHA